MTVQTSLLFTLQGDSYRQMMQWRQQIDLEVLRHQIEIRGQALVTRLGDQFGVQKVSSLPELGEADPYYGAYGGAYRFTFHPLSGPRTGPLSAEQSMPLTGPLPIGCELEVFNQMGGFAFFYPHRIDPLRLFLPNPPSLSRQSNGHSRPLNNPTGSFASFTSENPETGEMRFQITAPLYAALTQWGWYGRSFSAYDFIFIPTSSGCLVRVRMRERNVVLELNKEGNL
jgi:hypothetical protein